MALLCEKITAKKIQTISFKYFLLVFLLEINRDSFNLKSAEQIFVIVFRNTIFWNIYL